MSGKASKIACAELIRRWLRKHGAEVKKKVRYLNLATVFEKHPDCPKELKESALYRQNRRRAIFQYLIGEQYGVEMPAPVAAAPRKKPKSAFEFYNSDEWRRLRYRVLVKYGRKCMVCGATPEDGKVMHVDHIKPRSKFPHLELVFSNLQVLCEDCNLGKSNLDQTDWRPKPDESAAMEANLDLEAIADLRERGLLN